MYLHFFVFNILLFIKNAGTGTIISAYPLSPSKLLKHYLHQKDTTFAFITIKVAISNFVLHKKFMVK